MQEEKKFIRRLDVSEGRGGGTSDSRYFRRTLFIPLIRLSSRYRFREIWNFFGGGGGNFRNSQLFLRQTYDLLESIKSDQIYQNIRKS